MYTNEYADICFVCGFCSGSVAATVQEYERFPNLQTPDWQVFSHKHRYLLGKGKFPNHWLSIQYSRQLRRKRSYSLRTESGTSDIRVSE